MKRWRSLDQNLAERMDEEVLDKYKVEESKKGVEVTPWNGKEYAETRDIKLESVEINRRGGDEAAAKDDYHERSDKEN